MPRKPPYASLPGTPLIPRSLIVRKNEYRPTLVQRGATPGANCTVVCGRAIGACAFIGAGAAVARDVPAYAPMVGVPARQIGWMCRCAAARLEFHGAGFAQCSACGQRYRLENGQVRPAE